MENPTVALVLTSAVAGAGYLLYEIRRERQRAYRDRLAEAAQARANEYIETERCPMCHGAGRITKGLIVSAVPAPDLGPAERGSAP